MTVWGRITLQGEVVYERRAPNAGVWWYWFDHLMEKDPLIKQQWNKACRRIRERSPKRVVSLMEATKEGGE